MDQYALRCEHTHCEQQTISLSKLSPLRAHRHTSVFHKRAPLLPVCSPFGDVVEAVVFHFFLNRSSPCFFRSNTSPSPICAMCLATCGTRVQVHFPSSPLDLCGQGHCVCLADPLFKRDYVGPKYHKIRNDNKVKNNVVSSDEIGLAWVTLL